MIRLAHPDDVQLTTRASRSVLGVLYDLDNTLAERDRAFLAWARWFAQEYLGLEHHQAIDEAVGGLIALDAEGVFPRSRCSRP